ncbi:CLUMA_CG004760, isoform A [Clunio marinus]|uniref:CLUMA_CG004760, isoform A n=1 Tax=Clunio marinus TaxID=568069 RepID=A0A1J1HSM3_9DIPT|nr:CLUMA_CG004760, isoform A [Clunio marinus]
MDNSSFANLKHTRDLNVGQLYPIRNITRVSFSLNGDEIATLLHSEDFNMLLQARFNSMTLPPIKTEIIAYSS